ncbi:28 kDa heat- and acid-stable phosphoprotein-like [Haliotis rubra]|uniref:28 kDa heat- and acid-stable phosphoprotein-like n=1 Tax=Haliotis rubra TaxID=36100 RepID=UPI001EE4FF67|nr:28 kDa heat- and acid-stable phosphoprotein-like [Haliotis rubra]
MPRGKGGGGRGGKKNHKGKSRHFTDPREMEQQDEKDAKAREWRKKKGIEDSDDENEPEEVNKRGAVGELPPNSSSEEDSSDGEEARPKGVEHLIEIHNPNRTGNRTARKVTELDSKASTQLSRREREELEKQEAARRYQQLHEEGKTEEARADLARLALIRKQREEAAKKKEDERIAREAAKKSSKS